MVGRSAPSADKVVVIGDIMFDEWLTATADRRSSEVDIPIYDIVAKTRQLGGAGNVQTALRLMGVKAELLFNLGQSLPIKSRIVVDGVQVARFDQFDRCPPYPTVAADVENSIVVISDYGKGAINASEVETVAAHASSIWINSKFPQSSYTCLDMARPSTGGPTVIWVCNRDEYKKDKDWYDRQLRVWITKGPDGIEYRYNGAPWRAASRKAEARSVVSVCGAGDVTLAGLVAASLRGCDNEYMAKYAMAAAAIAVEQPFTYCPTAEEIDKRFYV